ncbi:hypothetical protein ACLOJK_001615, partial [Asimina triloba]
MEVFIVGREFSSVVALLILLLLASEFDGGLAKQDTIDVDEQSWMVDYAIEIDEQVGSVVARCVAIEIDEQVGSVVARCVEMGLRQDTIEVGEQTYEIVGREFSSVVALLILLLLASEFDGGLVGWWIGYDKMPLKLMNKLVPLLHDVWRW